MSVRSRCVSHWPHRSFLRRPLPERNSKSPFFFFFFAVFLLFSFYLLSSPVPFSLRADSKLTRSEPKSSLFNVSLVRLTLTPQSNSQYIFKYNLYCECWKVYGNTAAQKRKCFLVCFLIVPANGKQNRPCVTSISSPQRPGSFLQNYWKLYVELKLHFNWKLRAFDRDKILSTLGQSFMLA